MVGAYLLVETATDKAREVLATVGHNLSSCIALAESIVRGEVVASLHCNDLDALNRSIMEIAKKDGVKQILTFHVKTA